MGRKEVKLKKSSVYYRYDEPQFETLTEEEVRRLYKYARDPVEQIDILADLCLCTRKAMKDFLCVKKIKKADKVKKNSGAIKHSFNFDDIVAMRKSGSRWVDIAIHYNCSTESVRGWYNRIQKKKEKKDE